MATKTIDAFAAITSIDNADEVLVWDVSAGTTRKITFANFQSGYLTTTTGLQASGATVGATSQAQAFTTGASIGHTTSATAWADLASGTTAKASLRVRAGSAPTTPNAGDLWNDGALRYSEFIGPLVAAVQEIANRLERLEKPHGH